MSLYTRGNQILDDKGNVVRMKGVSRTGLEYAYVDLDAMIPETIAYDIRLMKKWGFNAIRFPLRDRFWLTDGRYKEKIKDWVNQTLEQNMYVLMDLHTQQDHPTLDPFMYRSETVLAFWIDVAKTYQDDHRIVFEIFNEPHGITPLVWWNGDDTYYGYKEILTVVRQHANNICLIGGLDYAYQFNFIRRNDTLLREMQNVSNLALAVHPYGYKGRPVNDGDQTDPIPTTILTNPLNHQGDCHLGVSIPSVPPSEYGWDESFGFVMQEELFPVIATEWGLDKPDNCIQGGWYNMQIVDYLNQLNMSYMAWAWVQDRLDYPSLLQQDFEPTGRGNKETFGPACSGATNEFYQGPGVLVMKDLQQFQHQRVLMTFEKETTFPQQDEDVFLRNILCLFFICFCFFNVLFFTQPPKKNAREEEIHKVISTTKLQNSIRIRSCHSLQQLK